LTEVERKYRKVSDPYWAYSIDEPDERIREMFEWRFGASPTDIIRDGTLAKCPIPSASAS